MMMSATHDRMWRLAATFPTLRKFVDRQRGPFDAERVLQALSEPWVTTGSRFALLFVLDVWNPAIRSELPEHLRDWSLAAAWGRWDDDHRKAALGWLQRPFFP